MIYARPLLLALTGGPKCFIMVSVCLDFWILDPQADLIFTFVHALICGLEILWEVVVIIKTAEIFITSAVTFEDLQTNEE